MKMDNPTKTRCIYPAWVLLPVLCLVVALLIGCKSEVERPSISGPELAAKSNLLTLLSGQSPSINDNDADGISDWVEDELAGRFAPVVKLHPGEQYLPADIIRYLPRVRMCFDVNLRSDDQLLKKGGVNLSSLVTQANRGQLSGLSAIKTGFFLEQTDNNGGDVLDSYRKETRRGTDMWVCYVHVRSAPESHSGMYDIQYIFFYAYNLHITQGPAEAAHEADLEHITVRVEGDQKTVHQIFYVAHDTEGRWYARQTSPGAKNGYSLTGDGRPVVYSARGTHASYPWEGQWVRGSGKPDDITQDGGMVWDCKASLNNVGEKPYPREGMQWIQYSGRWGEMGEASWTTGPYGPAYQDWWNSEP